MWPNNHKRTIVAKPSLRWTYFCLFGGGCFTLIIVTVRYGPVPTLSVVNKLLVSTHVSHMLVEKARKYLKQDDFSKK